MIGHIVAAIAIIDQRSGGVRGRTGDLVMKPFLIPRTGFAELCRIHDARGRSEGAIDREIFDQSGEH